MSFHLLNMNDETVALRSCGAVSVNTEAQCDITLRRMLKYCNKVVLLGNQMNTVVILWDMLDLVNVVEIK